MQGTSKNFLSSIYRMTVHVMAKIQNTDGLSQVKFETHFI